MSTRASSTEANRSNHPAVPAKAVTHAERTASRPLQELSRSARSMDPGVRRDDGGVWPVPIVLGLLTAFGLGAALFGDGLWDAASAVALAAPLVVAAWHILGPSGRK